MFRFSNITTSKQKSDLISECEKNFEKKLDNICETIIKESPKIIALSGPTCSGKTTTATKLTNELTKNGYEVHLVSIDNFFKDREALDRTVDMSKKNLDYDSVNAIDLELLAERSASIIAGNPTELPIYDFTVGKCSGYEKVDPNDHSIFIFEGIQAIYTEVTALFGEKYKSVYICVEDDIEVDGVYFGKRELRLMRRIVRDFKFRGAPPEFTLHLWRSVAANEDKSILPYADTVDLRINSFMEYEVFLMSAVLPEILTAVPDDNLYYPKACDILGKLEALEKISLDMVPKDSLLREFVG